MTERSILDFVDRVLTGQFTGPTWAAWRVVLKALFALPLDDDELAMFRALTGRSEPPAVQSSELWAMVGRRGGKSQVAALVAVFLATCRTYRLARGERGVLPIIAADRRQARVVADYVRGILHSTPVLEHMIVRELRESVELSTGVTIEIHTASFRRIRGYTVVAAVCDEVAYWPTDEHAAEPDAEILSALRPAMATIPDALLLCLSTPYAKRGELYRAVERHYGQPGDVLVVCSDTATMNPSVPERVIRKAFERDPVSAMSEYGRDGEIAFRADVSALLTEDAIRAVVPPGVRELPPDPERKVTAHFDAATGSGGDSAALAIAFAGDPAELALVRRWRPPFDPSAVVAEAARLVRRYGARRLQIDRYAPGLVKALFLARGVVCHVSRLDTSATFVELLGLVNSRGVRLLDSPELLAEVRRLERRSRQGGRDNVGHPPNAHDDVAAAAAGCLLVARGYQKRVIRVARPDADPRHGTNAVTGEVVTDVPAGSVWTPGDTYEHVSGPASGGWPTINPRYRR